MRVAIAGLGKAAIQGHLPAITSLAPYGAITLVAGADVDSGRRTDATKLLPGVPIFENANDMLASVRCDVLVIATQPSTHAELLAMALDQRLHIVCEKPFVLSQAQYDRVAQLHARRPDRGLISVHQYRYSPGWRLISRCARLARLLRIPFSITIDVERPCHNPLTVSRWRTDVELSGGMLADHGAHYLSLAWSIDEHLDVLAGTRILRDGNEHAGASIRLGSGMLTIQISTGAPTRRGRITFQAKAVEVRWTDGTLKAFVAGRPVLSRPVAALAKRSHVDALYECFYRDVVDNLVCPAWRAYRTAEALAVGRALVGLLEDSTHPAAAID